MPKTMEAYKCVSAGVAKVMRVPRPAMRPDYMLVKMYVSRRRSREVFMLIPLPERLSH